MSILVEGLRIYVDVFVLAKGSFWLAYSLCDKILLLIHQGISQ